MGRNMKRLIFSLVFCTIIYLLINVSDVKADFWYEDYVWSVDTLPSNITVENVDVSFPYDVKYYPVTNDGPDTLITVTPKEYQNLGGAHTLHVRLDRTGTQGDITFQLLDRSTNPGGTKYLTRHSFIPGDTIISIPLDKPELSTLNLNEFRQIYIRPPNIQPQDSKKNILSNDDMWFIHDVWFTQKVTKFTPPNIEVLNPSLKALIPLHSVDFNKSSIALDTLSKEGTIDVSEYDHIVIPIRAAKENTKMTLRLIDDTDYRYAYSGVYDIKTKNPGLIRIDLKPFLNNGQVDLTKLKEIEAFFGYGAVRELNGNFEVMDKHMFFGNYIEIGKPWFEINPVESPTVPLILSDALKLE